MAVFVLRLVADELVAGRIAGEVESIASGEVSVVRSAEELVARLRLDAGVGGGPEMLGEPGLPA